jgi:hypothetical protein
MGGVGITAPLYCYRTLIAERPIYNPMFTGMFVGLLDGSRGNRKRIRQSKANKSATVPLVRGCSVAWWPLSERCQSEAAEERLKIKKVQI